MPPHPSVTSPAVKLAAVPTPALVVDRAAFEHNGATMAAMPTAPRPHVPARPHDDR